MLSLGGLAADNSAVWLPRSSSEMVGTLGTFTYNYILQMEQTSLSSLNVHFYTNPWKHYGEINSDQSLRLARRWLSLAPRPRMRTTKERTSHTQSCSQACVLLKIPDIYGYYTFNPYLGIQIQYDWNVGVAGGRRVIPNAKALHAWLGHCTYLGSLEKRACLHSTLQAPGDVIKPSGRHVHARICRRAYDTTRTCTCILYIGPEVGVSLGPLEPPQLQ